MVAATVQRMIARLTPPSPTPESQQANERVTVDFHRGAPSS